MDKTIKEKSKEIPKEKENTILNKRPIQTPTIKKEELLKFVYDMSSEKLTASSFKYAMRNLSNDQKEKEDYLLVLFLFNF